MLNVKQRQMNLKFLGYYGGRIDGIVGNGTISAYEEFQRDYGLKVDGIYGPKTNAKLIEIIKAEQKALGVPQDGIAGPITVNAKDNQKITWDTIKYFKEGEFTCQCGCGLNNINLKLVVVLDKIRAHFGSAVIITSGCRCRKHNEEVGGVPESRHISGKAADFYVRNVAKSKVLAYCKELVNQGVLRYAYTNSTNMRNAIHIDIL
jgi:hypothetical protein